MAFLGIYVFTGFGAESFGFEQTSGQYYNETNLADGWIYTSNLDDDFVDNGDYPDRLVIEEEFITPEMK